MHLNAPWVSSFIDDKKWLCARFPKQFCHQGMAATAELYLFPILDAVVQGVPEKDMPRLHCQAVYQFTLAFAQLHKSGFTLEFKTMHESIWHVIADLWRGKGKICGCFKNGTSVVLQQCQNQVSFQSNGSDVVINSYAD